MDARKYRAASQLADGLMADAAIANEAGIDRRQLTRWKNEPAFAALIQGLIGEVTDAIRHEAVATKAGRLRILTDLHNKLLQVIEARAAATLVDGDRPWAAGESTGIIVTKETWGKVSSQEAAIDSSLFREILNLHERIARELGQWDFGKVDVRHTGRIDHVIRVPAGLRNLSDDELDALEVIARKVHAAKSEAVG